MNQYLLNIGDKVEVKLDALIANKINRKVKTTLWISSVEVIVSIKNKPILTYRYGLTDDLPRVLENGKIDVGHPPQIYMFENELIKQIENE